MNRLKKGDEVIIISGKNKGCRGTIVTVFPAEGRVIVEGINIVKKHVKHNPNKGIEGGIIEKEAPLHISKIALYNTKTKKADRVGSKLVDGNKKMVRYFRSTGKIV